MLITNNYFFMLSPNCNLIKQHKLSILHSIITIASNSSILALKFRRPRQDTLIYNIKGDEAGESNKDIMLETYRRTELIVFLLNNAEVDEARQKPLIQTANCFKINSQIIDFKIDTDRQSDKGSRSKLQKSMIKQIDSRDYLMAYKVGFLLK